MVSFLGKAVILFTKNKLGGTFCIPFKVYAHKFGAEQRTSRELRHPSVMLTLTNTDPVPTRLSGTTDYEAQQSCPRRRVLHRVRNQGEPCAGGPQHLCFLSLLPLRIQALVPSHLVFPGLSHGAVTPGATSGPLGSRCEGVDGCSRLFKVVHPHG